MFQIGEIVMIKRTGGKWEEGTVIAENEYFVTVEIDIIDTFRGQPWYDKPTKGTKIIPINEVDDYIKRMKITKNNT